MKATNKRDEGKESNKWERFVCVILLALLVTTSFAGILSYVQGDRMLVGATVLVVEFIIAERLLRRIW